MAFKGHEGHTTVKQPPLHARPLNFWNLKMVLGDKGHIGVMVWYGSKCEKGQRFGLFWPFWPLKVNFFQKIKFWNMISLWFKFGKIMLASFRDNWSKGQNLIQRLPAFEKKFSKFFFRFLPDFQPIFRIWQKIFDQRPKGHFHGLYMALLAFKGQFWEWSRVSRIQPSLWFWFGLSTWLYLKDKFWLPIYGTGIRSAPSLWSLFGLQTSLPPMHYVLLSCK